MVWWTNILHHRDGVPQISTRELDPHVFPNEVKNHAVQGFKSILHVTVRNSLWTRSPIPSWAVSRIAESWNITLPDVAATEE